MKHLLVFALLAAAFAVISVEAVLYPIEYRLPLDVSFSTKFLLVLIVLINFLLFSGRHRTAQSC